MTDSLKLNAMNEYHVEKNIGSFSFGLRATKQRHHTWLKKSDFPALKFKSAPQHFQKQETKPANRIICGAGCSPERKLVGSTSAAV